MTTQNNIDIGKPIQETLERHLENENHSKFLEVLDFLGESLCDTVFEVCNSNLIGALNQLEKTLGVGDPNFGECIRLKIQQHSFRIMIEFGKILVKWSDAGNPKADEYFIKLIKVLVYHGLIGNGCTANFALVELEQLCMLKKVTLSEVYRKHQSKILRVIIKAILRKLEKHRNNDCSVNGSTNGGGLCKLGKSNCVILYMTRSFEVFGVSDIKSQDVAQSLVIITYLILKEKYLKTIELFLRHLATSNRSDVAQLLSTHIEAIMVSLLLDGKMSSYDMNESLKRLCSIAQKPRPSSLLETKFASIKGRLLLHYSIDPRRVKDALYHLSTLEVCDELDQPFPDTFEDENTLMEYITPALIGILLGIDGHFNSISNEFGSTKSINYIRSLTILISKLPANQVELIHPKILSTLCLILGLKRKPDESLSSALVELWKEFIQKLTKDLRTTLLINISVAIHDLIDDCPGEVAKLYSLLLCGKFTKDDQNRLKCLFFIPDKPDFEKIYRSLTPFVHRGYNKESIRELELAINCALLLIKFSNRKCHILAVDHIRQLLKSNQHLLTSHMLVNLEEPLDEMISRTIESLLSVLSTKECIPAVAECLGIIGAVNPVRLNHLIYGNIRDKENEGPYFDLGGRAFVVHIIERLKNSLLSDRQSESEAASYTFQVILMTNEKYLTQISNELSEEARKAVDLCKNTKYVAKQRSPPNMNVPLYIKFKNEGQYSYGEWLDRFFLALVAMIEKESIRNILHACSLNFKFNLKFAEHLLPIVMIYVIVTRKADMQKIRNEIMAIVTDTTGVSSQDYDTVHKDDYEHSIQTLHLQCSNFVFCLIDTLLKFKNGPKPERYDPDPLNRLLKEIPTDKLAILACKCRAYARALCYFDQYYFETKNWNRKDIGKVNSFDAYWTALQKVYMALDDRYEAAGVQMRRTSPITVADDIANLESSGRFEKASIYYESLLESTRDQLDKKILIEDALKCLLNQGDDQRLYERSTRLMMEYPSFKRSILPAAVEAFWKLGKWDELDDVLRNNSQNTMLESTSISQGSLLDALRTNTSNINDQIVAFWERSMKPLSIAMIDRSAYFRGYQTLLVLHSIEDYSLAIKILAKKNFDTQDLDENTMDSARCDMDDQLKFLFSTWSRRNKLVQPSLMSLEPLLAWQRSIASVFMKKYSFMQSNLNRNIGSMWLTSANVAREARCFDRSFYCLAQAQKWFGSDLLKSNLELQVECTIAQAVLNWEQGESTEAIRCLTSAIQRLQYHKLHEHLEMRKSKNEDIRRKTNNPYHHPDAEPYFDINNEDCEQCLESDQSDRESFAKLKILLTRYTEEAAAGTPRALLNMYEECVHLGVNQEDVYLLLARYYDKLANYYTENPHVLKLSDRVLNAGTNSPHSIDSRIVKLDKAKGGRQKSSSQDKKDKEMAHREDVISKLMEQSVLAFGNSLKWGVRYLEESMPRMLNIWFDLGSKKCLESMAYYPRAINSRIESTVRMFDTILLKEGSGLPSYYFISALSLLLSRVCHPHQNICDRTSRILEQLLIDYPHQMLWRLQAMLHDDNEERKKAGSKIIRTASKKSSSVQTLYVTYLKWTDLFRALCVNNTDRDPRLKQAKQRKLASGKNDILQIEPRLGNLSVEGKFLAPIQSAINPILPTESDYENLKQHQIYPERYMTFIKRLSRDCYIYNSLQQPRRIELICEDGKSIAILCKANDDLRKDSRCIEFFNLVNRIFRRSGISSARFFEISTFLVLPLESSAGIIEMLPNCDTLRSIVEKLYKETLGSAWTVHELLKKRTTKDRNTDADSYQSFVERVLPKVTPPVFQEFYKRKFTEPVSWYMARLAYSRSLALSSMVGYIIGLGDRHLDNILVDLDTGKIVHVDYNLLFHQADNLPVPEVVPFRLTHNIVAALGPMGTEGNFRKFSEIAVRMMRKEKELLLTALKPFLHDPCCEWIRDRDNRSVKEKDIDRDGNKMARERIEVVERKLKGFPRSGNQNKPLTVLNAFSVEAQVDILIEEATDVYNLSQMYYGWSPHI